MSLPVSFGVDIDLSWGKHSETDTLYVILKKLSNLKKERKRAESVQSLGV